MTNKSTKRKLISSVIALFICFAMMVGTTFAWFTDSVSSTNNTIVAGNLDIELYYQNDETAKETDPEKRWVNVGENTNIFKENTLWEPGHTEVVKFKIVNEGTLALKYQLGVNVASETSSTNVAGEPFKLSDYIKYSVISGEKNYSRDEAVKAAEENNATALSVDYQSATTPLASKAEKVVTMVVYMPETVGNEANAMMGAATPSINLGIKLYATQVEGELEKDSFGSDYDKDAWHDGFKVYTADDLQDAINNGKSVTLMNDIKLTESIVIPAAEVATYSMRANNAIVIDLNGKTISNENGYVFETQGNIVITGNGTVSGLGGIRATAGSITIENGNFYASSKWQDGVYQHTLKATNTQVTINGGNFDATVKGHTNAVLNASENSTITINGGTFKNVAGELTQFDPYIFTYEKNGKVIINNGTFYGGWRFNGETATTEINGGNFTVGFDGQSFHASSTHVVTVHGGTFVAAANAKLTNKLADIVAEDAYVAENAAGTCYVIKYDVDKKNVYVENAAQLQALANVVNTGVDYFEGKTVVLTADIDLAGINWTPIGSAAKDHGFMGNFDGNEKVIKNLTITNPALDSDGYAYAGLFGVTEGIDKDNQNTIKNLIIENVTINTTGSIVAAAIAYPYYTVVEGVTVCGNINITGGDYTSGALAYTRRCVNASNITVSGNSGSTITGRQTIGGVISDIQMNGGLKANYSNFSASNVTISGTKQVGGISGIICEQTLNGATVKNVTLVCSDARVGIISGALGGVSTIVGVTHENVTGANSIVGATYDNGTAIEVSVNNVYNGAVATIEAALAAAKTGDVIAFNTSINKNITVAQQADVKIVLDGNGFAFANVITVDGKSATYTTAGLTIKNVVFKAESIAPADACIMLGVSGDNNTRYTCNVTVENCTFDVPGAVGVKSYTGGDKNLTIKNSTATANAHSLVQAKGIDGVLVENCTVNSKNGLNFNNSTNVTVSGCTVNVKGYAVRFGEGTATNDITETYTIKNSVLTSANDDGDAAIILRGTANKATLNIANTTITATTKIANNAVDATVVIDGKTVVENVASLNEALKAGENVVLSNNVTVNNNETGSNGYGATGVQVKGSTFDGNGNSFGVNAWNTWDSAINISGGTIQNVTINSGMRGIFMGSATADVYIDNVTIDGTIYTFNSDDGSKEFGVYISNSTLNGWTSFSDVHKEVIFTNCDFGEGNGYAFCRPYNAASFVGCDFEAGYEIEAIGVVTFKNCTIGGVALTDENLDTLVVGGIENAIVK